MKSIKALMITLFLVFLVAPNVNAIPVNITQETPFIASGDETSVPDIEAIIYPLMPDTIEVYRVTPGNPNTEGYVLADSYETEFLPTFEIKEDAIIRYVSGSIISPIAYLLAKDGQGIPSVANDGWFLYNLTGLGWTGTEDITITGLWPAQGSFSHISIYDAPTTVPEPSTLLLFGLGLIGLAGVRRKVK
jgi:hypothetical protein